MRLEWNDSADYERRMLGIDKSEFEGMLLKKIASGEHSTIHLPRGRRVVYGKLKDGRSVQAEFVVMDSGNAARIQSIATDIDTLP